MPPGRRTVLSALAAVAGGATFGGLVAGCDPDTPAATRSPGPDGPADAADQALVDQVRADLESRLLAVVAARQAFPRTATAMTALEQMHLAHRAVLDPDASPSVASSGETPRPARTARAAVRRVLAGERAHHDLLARGAGAAASGPLARLLASMCASVSQHLVTTPAALAVEGIDVPSPTAATDPTDPVTLTTDGLTDLDTAALQTTLAAEHAAVYLYGVLGARTSQSAAPELFAAVRDTYVVHRDRRDQLIGALAGTDAEPTAPAVAYRFPGTSDLDTASGVSAAAADLEADCAATYGVQVGSATASTRRTAVAWLDQTAVRELAFRGTPGMFPGEGELADR